MGRELWGSRSIGEHTERQLESMKSKKKVSRTFAVSRKYVFDILWTADNQDVIVLYGVIAKH